MKDSALRLQDKIILLTGPFNGTTQALLRTLSEFGSDVAFVSDHVATAGKYCDGLNEAREVHPEYGRTAHFYLPLKNAAEIKEALGRVAETFGRVDVLLDATPLSWSESDTSQATLETSRQLSEGVLPFYYAKQRGRLIFLIEDACLDRLGSLPISPETRESFRQFVLDLAKSQLNKNITANVLSLGLTEDFMLRHYAGAGTIRKGVQKIAETYPEIKLVESTEIGLGAAYLASAMSTSVTGETVKLTHGFHLI